MRISGASSSRVTMPTIWMSCLQPSTERSPRTMT
nr:MAG TPA_asm: hypothetical protein [Caudoviricetes sp.]